MAVVTSISERYNGFLYNIVNSSTGLRATARYGDSGFPENEFTLADGTAADQANQVYKTTFSLAAAANLDIDLQGATGELDVMGTALLLVEVRRIYVWITTTRASTVYVRVGPQNVTNGWQGPWSVATANGYTTVHDEQDFKCRPDGALTTVDATHKIIRINNASGVTVAGGVIITGVKS